MTQLYLVRHGETEWSKSGQHTSVTDLKLTEHGREQALALKGRLNPDDFDLILCSPRTRAQQTAKLAGFDNYEIDEDLAEWFYGDYEGRHSTEIQATVPNWQIWTHPCPGGETADEVRERLTRIVERVQTSEVDKAVAFAHGHSLRVLATCWLELPITFGASLPLDTATISILGSYKARPAILRWNS